MRNYTRNFECQECGVNIDRRVYQYSLDYYDVPLCRDCQHWFRDILDYTTATNEAIDLYFELKKRGVPAELEKNDGYKTIDIAVPDAKVNIEVDGGHHNFKARQAMKDLERTLYSYKKGFSTLRIPNSLARYHLEDTADLITEYLVTSRDRNYKRR